LIGGKKGVDLFFDVDQRELAVWASKRRSVSAQPWGCRGLVVVDRLMVGQEVVLAAIVGLG